MCIGKKLELSRLSHFGGRARPCPSVHKFTKVFRFAHNIWEKFADTLFAPRPVWPRVSCSSTPYRRSTKGFVRRCYAPTYDGSCEHGKVNKLARRQVRLLIQYSTCQNLCILSIRVCLRCAEAFAKAAQFVNMLVGMGDSMHANWRALDRNGNMDLRRILQIAASWEQI